MYIQNELNAMTQRMLNEDLLNTILDACRQEQDETGSEEIGLCYREGSDALAAILDENQQAMLAEAEETYREIMRRAMKFCFVRGLYAGFQQFFTEDATARPFETFVEAPTLGQERDYLPWSEPLRRTLELQNALHAQLDDAGREHLTSISAAWDTWFLGVRRFTFYLGYRYALSAVDDAGPMASTMHMVSKILQTEHNLAFTFTWAERERNRDALEKARKKRQRTEQSSAAAN